MIYIYGLVCPISGDVRYIGKTSRSIKKRLVAHIQEAKRRHSSHKLRWLATLERQGLRPSILILEEVPSDARWQDSERSWIAKAIKEGWPITNQTAGGEGLDFLDPCALEQYRKNLSASSKRVYYASPSLRAALIAGTKKSWAENREERIAACMSGWTDEAKRKHATSMLAVRSRPEFKAAQSRGAKKAWQNHRPAIMESFARPETKAKQAARKRRSWADPDTRQRMMNRWTTEARAKQAAAVGQRREKMLAARTPESRAKQAATLKATWAKRKAAMKC